MQIQDDDIYNDEVFDNYLREDETIGRHEANHNFRMLLNTYRGFEEASSYCIKYPFHDNNGNQINADNNRYYQIAQRFFSPEIFHNTAIDNCNTPYIPYMNIIEQNIIRDTRRYGFCGENMSSSYLYHSIMQLNHYALIRFLVLPNGYRVSNAIAFNIDNDGNMEIDALCSNNIFQYKGASLLMNRIFDFCIVANINNISLKAIDTKDTTGFYEKMGFQKIGQTDSEGLIKMTNQQIVSKSKRQYREWATVKYDEFLDSLFEGMNMYLQEQEQEQQEQQQEQQHMDNMDMDMDEQQEQPMDEAEEERQIEQLITIANMKQQFLMKRQIKRPSKYNDFFTYFPPSTFPRKEGDIPIYSLPMSAVKGPTTRRKSYKSNRSMKKPITSLNPIKKRMVAQSQSIRNSKLKSKSKSKSKND